MKGVSISSETLKDWGNRIAQNTEPTLIPNIKSEEVNGKTIVIVEVQEFPLKPVATRGRCFRRLANSNQQMSPQEIAQMHLASTGNSWDALLANDRTIDDIDFEKVYQYIKTSSDTGRKKLKIGDNPNEVLEKLELTKDSKSTWAALLLFGKRPQSPLTQAQVHCGRFKRDVKIIDDCLFEGSIIDQVDLVMEFLRKHINVQFNITGEPRRDEIWDYPLDALREAVINSICHREYSDTADIQIKIYDDSINIWNPGALPFGITIDSLYQSSHSSRPRNKLIAQIFYDIGLIERYGSGIQRMINSCLEAGLPEPVFEEKNNGFSVIFHKDIYTKEYLRKLELNERQINAIIYTKEKEKITNTEYQELTGIKDRLASIELKDLIEKDILEKKGKTGRGTYYVLRKVQKAQ